MRLVFGKESIESLKNNNPKTVSAIETEIYWDDSIGDLLYNRCRDVTVCIKSPIKVSEDGSVISFKGCIEGSESVGTITVDTRSYCIGSIEFP